MEYIFVVLKEFGLVNGLLTIGVLFMFIVLWTQQKRIYKQHDAQLKDKESEINRLATDNREYRDRFLKKVDDIFSSRENKQ